MSIATGQHYVALLETSESTPRTVEIVESAVKDPAVFCYADILHSAAFQAAVASGTSEMHALHSTLKLLSYGTVADVATWLTPQVAASLTAPLRSKLLQLSLLSLCMEYGVGGTDISYAAVQKRLLLQSADELEAVVVDAVSSGLVSIRLNSLAERLRIVEVHQGRDLSVDQIGVIADKLTAWGAVCDAEIKRLAAVS